LLRKVNGPEVCAGERPPFAYPALGELRDAYTLGCMSCDRAGDHALLENRLPPPKAAYLGWEPDSVLDGWEARRQLFQELAPLKVAL
jgi:hypothetical protein